MAGAGGCGIGGGVGMGVGGRGTEEGEDWEKMGRWGGNYSGRMPEWERRQSEWLRRTEDEDDLGGGVEEYDLWGGNTNDRPSGRRLGERWYDREWEAASEEWDREDLDIDRRSGGGGGGQEGNGLCVVLGCTWVVMAMGWVLSKVAK